MVDIAIATVFNVIENSLDDEETVLLMDRMTQNLQAFTVFMLICQKKSFVPRLTGFTENVVPQFCDDEFRYHFRIPKCIFEQILPSITEELISKTPGGREETYPTKQLLIFLSYMANQESMREISLYFGVGLSTVHGVIRRVARALVDRYCEVLNWPDFRVQQEIGREFQLQYTIPDVVGVLDGTHIRLAGCPHEDSDYINRKSFASIQLQVVVDNKLLIRDAYTGWPGSTHDARVLRNSSLFDQAEAGQRLHQNKLILADSAYPLKEWLITPFRDNGRLNPQQRRFNRIHSSARQVVERAIGHLKGRFRRLRELTVHDTVDMVYTIISGCILHNLCILNGDNINDFIQRDDDGNNHPNMFQNIYPNAAAGIIRRQQLMQFLCG